MADKLRTLISLLNKQGYSSPVLTKPLHLLAKGTDASFYRLLPEVIIQVNSEDDIQLVLKTCNDLAVPVTFKAGGTSLSGQTITDSVLVEIGPGFTKYKIKDQGKEASFQPGVRGGYANILLSAYGRKIGPSPASINAAKIGGIVANNASGSSYGIATNSYNTISALRIVFADGTLLDTADEESRLWFRQSHTPLIRQIEALRNTVITNQQVEAKIRQRFGLKNTCGYGVNSLVDFADPVDIIAHLMVGSEGTLGFISEVTFRTVVDYPQKACALLFFPSIVEAAKAVIPLRSCEVSAAELMDRNALRAVETNPGMPVVLKTLDDGAAALLIETSAPTREILDQQMNEIRIKISGIPTLFPISFTTDNKEFQAIWKVRKGLFTSAAAARPKGTACIIEDIAFRGEVLGNAITDLQQLLEDHGYLNPVIWGHLLDGNIHFVIMPDFEDELQLASYKSFMHELADLVVDKHNGSLKAEHGTGRNMAPFVEKQWGTEIYNIMREIKTAFDPNNILNPGVILNDDPDIFAKNIKPLPQANPIIDDCIECGFCEPNCPSREFTVTPRQRIVLYREIIGLTRRGKIREANRLVKDFAFYAEESCATDGLCAIECPVGINTGKLIKEIRFEKKSRFELKTATIISKNFGITVGFARIVLAVVYAAGKIMPVSVMKGIALALHRASFRIIPLWNEFMPAQGPRIDTKKMAESQNPDKVVYFPACINRIFGISKDYENKIALTKNTVSLLGKAGYEIIYPENLSNLCCGMAFDSKGFKDQGSFKLHELETVLLNASNNGEFPVLCDMSPCLLRMKELMDPRLKLYEPVEFTLVYLKDKLEFRKLPRTITVHTTCSSTKMGLDDQLVRLAGMCAENVFKPQNTGCCGWAGDKGFNLPDLNKSALKYLKEELPTEVTGGYSNSRTCEIGLTLHSGVSYKSILHLVDEATVKI